MQRSFVGGCLIATVVGLFALGTRSDADEPPAGWADLITPGGGVSRFRAPTGRWAEVGHVELSPSDRAHLAPTAGRGVLVNDPPGRTANLITKDEYADVEVHLEFLVPAKSNSGIKLMGLYEIQIHDSHGVETPTGSDNGGVYPRAKLLPTYRHIDEGIAPLVNASKPAGEWQELDITFQAPRFDAGGKKVKNARFERVVLNGQVIHRELDVEYPTGHAWDMKPELPRGPIFLQADHGPVAFRSLRVKVPVSAGTSRP